MTQRLGSGLKRIALASLSSALLTCPLLLAQPQSATKGAVILIDTDDACRLVIDDEDKGVITPDKSQKFGVSLGQHILKCTVESAPALVWRKIIDVKDSSQVAAVITLKALHVQYDQAVTKTKTQKDEASATAARQLQEAEAEEKQREAAKATPTPSGASVPEQSSQFTAHFNAGLAAFAQAQQAKAQMKSASAENVASLQRNLDSACGRGINEFKQAIDFTQAGDRSNRAQALANIGAFYELDGHYNEAIEAYKGAIGWAPDVATYYGGLSTSQAKAGRFDDAKEACRVAVARDASLTGLCWLNLGIVLFNSGKIAESIEPLRIATSANPQSAVAWYLLGQALIQQGGAAGSSDQAAAIRALQRSVLLDQSGSYAESARAKLSSLNAPSDDALMRCLLDQLCP